MAESIKLMALKGEKLLQKEVDALRESNIRRISSNTKKLARETVENLQPDVEETIQELQVRMELLRNIRLNWESFQKDAAERGLDLRLNQLKGLHELIAFLTDSSANHSGTHRGLMGYYVQPTGAGKTGLFSIEAKLADVPTLILVPFDNLLDQTKVDLCAIGGFNPDDIGIVGGGRKEIGKRVIVATYASHASLIKKNKSYRDHVQQECKLVICDEVHMALGERTHNSVLEIDGIANGIPTDQEVSDMDAEQDAIEHMESITPTKAVKIGFTATPQLSAKHVEEYFPQLIGRIYMADLIDAGILVPYRIVQADGSVFAGEIESYITQEAETSILQREGVYRKLLGEYAETLVAYEKEKNTSDMPLRGMAFCTNLEECDKFLKQAEGLGIKAQIITGREAKGKSGQEVILAAKNQLVSGEIDLIITVEKLCAGFNFPEVNAIIWARITSMAKTIQGIGRGARSYNDEDGLKKEYCTVFETNWSLKDNNRGRVPLRFADALAQNGENPERICAMANGLVLDYKQPQSIDTLCAAIIEQFTPEQWATIISTQRARLRINGLSLRKIATIFEIEGDPVGYHSVHLALGRAIFGDCEVLREQDSETLREAITAQFKSEEWARMKHSQKEKLKINGLGLKAIATMFEIEGDPIGYYSVHLALGRAIFGDQSELQEKEVSSEAIRAAIMNQYTPEQWIQFKGSQRTKFKINGLGLKALATTFGIEGDPIGYHSDYLALGRAIFGNCEVLQDRKISTDLLQTLISAKYSPKEWAEMKSREKTELKINTLGITAIARCFSISDSPIKNHLIHLALGRAIFGDHPAFDEAEKRT